ncbi:MAG: response regulator transcription factor [Terriglobales bacterium]
MTKILIVDDDVVLTRNLCDWLTRERYTVEQVADGKEALDRLRFHYHDLVILDWLLPNMSGLEVCRQYRLSGGKVPILMLTGRNDVIDKEEALDAGADDYLTKPFHLKELSARVRALLRRPPQLNGAVLSHGGITLDTTGRSARKDGKELALLPREYALLEFFMRYPNRVFSPEVLVERVWQTDSEVSPDSIRTYVTRLRAKIDVPGDRSLIRNIHGAGYKLDVPNLDGKRDPDTVVSPSNGISFVPGSIQ